MGNGYPGNLQDKLMLKVCRNIFFLQSLTWYFVLLFENELIFETCVIQDEKQTFSYETQGAIPDVSTSTPSIPSVSRPKKGDPSLDVSTNFLISTKAPTTIGKKKNKPSPDLLLSSIDLLPFPESERTAGKSHHHQWKKTDGFSFGYATICNLHMPTSTPSKDNILAPTSSCTWPKQCKAGVICESRSNRAWHPQWKKPSWPSLKGWNRLLTTVFLIVDAYWCLLMGDVIMNLMAEPEMWKWLWINMPVRQHDMRKTSTKTKTWFTLTYI